MNNTQKCFELTTLAAALLVAFGSAMAADEDTPASLDQPVSSVSAGIGYWNNDRPQFGIFDGMRDDGAYLLLDANINKRDDATGTWKTLEVQDLGTNAREIRGEYLRQGDFGVTLDYNQTPRVAPYTINTNLSGIGTEEQVVGTNIATGTLTGTNVQLETERKKLGVGFYKNLQAFMPGVDIKVNFSNERKEGNRHWSRGGAAEFAAEPIDYTTNQLDATLNYVGKALQLSGGYVGSWFKNDNDLVCSRTAAASCTGDFANNVSNPAFLSLPFDNQAHQAFMTGAYRFTPTTVGTFKVSYTHATVDEAIPTASASTGTAFTYINAPTHFDGEVNTTLMQLGLTARPMPKLSILANVRYHDVDEQTPRYDLVGNNVTEVVTVNSTPLSYTTTSGKLEGTYNLADGYNLVAGVDYSEQDRTVPFGGDLDLDGLDDQRYVPFRAELDELTYRIQLRKSLSETLNGAIAFLHSKRDGSEYADAIHAHGGINPINISDRDRNKVRLSLDWNPMERLGLQFNFENSQDDYGPSNEYGLYEGSAQLFSADADYTISDTWRITGWFSHDITKASQFNGTWDRITEDHEKDRRSHLEDTGDSVGLGLRGAVNPKLKVGADLQWTRTKSEYNDIVIPIGENGDPDIGYVTGTGPLPDITNKMTKLGLFAEYALRKNADLRIDLIHEIWKTDDWSWQFSDGSDFQYGATTDGTTVIVDPKQNATFVGARYSYRF